MSEITFESGGRTWKYKDKPRQIAHGEHYLIFRYDEPEVHEWPGAEPSWAAYIPVEPVEPEEVTVTLDTQVAKIMAKTLDSCGYGTFSRYLGNALRDQGVDVEA